jgi:hypothetical protein
MTSKEYRSLTTMCIYIRLLLCIPVTKRSILTGSNSRLDIETHRHIFASHGWIKITYRSGRSQEYTNKMRWSEVTTLVNSS